jgi:hypothetical protein
MSNPINKRSFAVGVGVGTMTSLIFCLLVMVPARISPLPDIDVVDATVQAEIVRQWPTPAPTPTTTICPACEICPSVYYRSLPDPRDDLAEIRLAVIDMDQALKVLRDGILAYEGHYDQWPHLQAILATNYLLSARDKTTNVEDALVGWIVGGDLTCDGEPVGLSALDVCDSNPVCNDCMATFVGDAVPPVDRAVHCLNQMMIR